MSNKTFAMFILVIGLAFLIVGAGVAISSMNQAIDSPFMASANNVNTTWNTETAGIVIAVIGALLILLGIWILFQKPFFML
ncbi:MAG: hypothetical protein ABSF44_13485 [Candidatus Bathyarchaeia archaeon]|jgi:uncharacterized membrane protein YidH (DUF202 family)